VVAICDAQQQEATQSAASVHEAQVRSRKGLDSLAASDFHYSLQTHGEFSSIQYWIDPLSMDGIDCQQR
jgi:hypothetical protein